MIVPNCHLNGKKTYVFSSRNELLSYIQEKKTILIAMNALKIVQAKNFIVDLLENNIGYPDGFGAVWALKNRGYKDAIKIPGCELWLNIVKSWFNSRTFYLIGSTQWVIETVVDKLKSDFPGIKILNYRNGYINNDLDKMEIIQDLKQKNPDIVFVATGSPNQEILMKEMLEYHPALYMGLGGSFDVYVGLLKRAPEFWRKYNLEWLYRLVIQPTRITRQLQLIRFFYLNLLGRI